MNKKQILEIAKNAKYDVLLRLSIDIEKQLELKPTTSIRFVQGWIDGYMINDKEIEK